MSIKNIFKKIDITHGRKIKAHLYFEKGLQEVKKRNFELAISFFEKSKKHYTKINKKENVTEAIAEIAITNYYQSPEKMQESINILKVARDNFDKSCKRSDVLAKIYLYLGIIEYGKRNYTEAIKLYKQAQSLTSSHSLLNGCILDNLAIHHLRSKNFHLAQKYLEEAFKIKVKIGNTIELAYTSVLLGRYFSSIEETENALKYLKTAEALLRRNENYTSLVRVLDEIAKVHILKSETKEAETYYQKALNVASKVSNKKIYAFLNCTLAEIFTLNNNAEKGLDILKKEVEPAFKTPREKAILKKAQSKIYTKLEHYELALEKNHEALSLFHTIENHIDAIKCHIDLAYIYVQKNNEQMATSSLLEAIEITKQHGLQIFTQKVEDILFEFDRDEWTNIVNQELKQEENSNNSKSLIETLDLLEELTQEEFTTKDPLLSLLKIGRSISAETNFEKLIGILEDETKQALEASECNLFMYKKERNELWSKKFSEEEVNEIRFCAKTGLSGYVARTGEGVNIKDVHNDSRFDKNIDKLRNNDEKIKTMLCIPVKNIKQEIVGVFQVINKTTGRYFSDQDEDLLMAIGSSSGIALENAYLFQKQKTMLEEQKNSLASFINALSTSIDARDSITAGHSGRVKDLSEAISQQLNLDESDIEVIKCAANLHDIGKIGIRDDVLLKDGRLTPEEYEHIQEHAQITADILDKIYFQEKFKEVPLIASSHHEKYDGSGYFRKLKNSEIPLGGRILAAADVFDAITSKRHYREKMPIEMALKIMLDGKGTHFDPCVIEKFFEITTDQILGVIISTHNKSLEEEQKEYFSKYNLNDLLSSLHKEEDDRTVIENLLVTNFNKVYLQK